MKNIVLARIDDRLIHGQVVTSWLKSTDGNKVVIVDEQLCNDMIMKRVLFAAAPKGVEVVIYTIAEAIEVLKGEPDKGERIVILVKYPGVFEQLMEGGIPLETIILGGMGNKPGRKRFNRNVSASPEEIECMKRIIDKGVKMFYQLVPRDTAADVSKLF